MLDNLLPVATQGYMALPLQKAVLGDIGVFYGASYIAIFHCYVWTYGVKLLSKKKRRSISRRSS